MEDLRLAGRLLIHDPLQHIVRLFVDQIEVFEREEGKMNDVTEGRESKGLARWSDH